MAMCLATRASSGAATTLHYKWVVENIFWSPDGQQNMVMAINGGFPGPNITAKVGDTVEVELSNNLNTEGVVIHWHGIRQFTTPWYDGTASVSQCVINPGQTFLYKFKVDKAGTYFYHGHYGMQREAGLYGSLIVEEGDQGQKEPFQYDGEFSLLLSDWWHQTVYQQEVGLSSDPFQWINEPQSLLINGRGQYNCSLASRYNSSAALPECSLGGGEQWAPNVLKVLPNKTYRLRIASTTSLASLNLAIGGHNVTVVEADGNYVQPFSTTDVDIYSGETYSVLFTTNQNPDENYWISVGVRGRLPQTPQALALVNYLPNHASKFPTSPPPVTPQWDDYNRSKAFSNRIQGLEGTTPPPPADYDRRIMLLNTQNTIDGLTVWAINNVSLSFPPTPYLGALKYGIKAAFDQTPPPDTFPDCRYDIMSPPANPNATTGNAIYTLDFNSTVDVILQNANTLQPNDSEIHPWHMHGHNFWVLGYGDGKFQRGDEKLFEKAGRRPPLKNTAVIFPFGWTALRFVADNPGAWPFHCHIEPHLHMGMGVVIAEGVEFLADVPRETLSCGLTGMMFSGNGEEGHN
ncbi:unnamed protein product [Linum tenue]|uniref:L-ascorbate oxidase n=2 Tax=Linum tenue TaxID=586396 RepID=A0AAV0IKL3_9ROSI|nr:unnamed protein product [Linum tenue]